MMARPISQQAVIEAYRDLGGVRKVAKRLRIGTQRVMMVLRAHGIELPTRAKIDVARAAALYRSGLSLEAVAAQLGVTRSGLSLAFQRHGVQTRTISEGIRLSERCRVAAEKRAEADRQAAMIAAREGRAAPKPIVRRREVSNLRIPQWVPRDLRTEYSELTRLYGEHRAASEIRAMKAAAQ